MSNEQRVMAFIAAWEERDLERILALMTPDAVYDNIPMPVLTGREEIRRFLEPFFVGCTFVKFKVHHIAQTPNGVVLTERTDHFEMGGAKVAIPVMGVFEFRDGLIAAWRDYFDLAQFQNQIPAP